LAIKMEINLKFPVAKGLLQPAVSSRFGRQIIHSIPSRHAAMVMGWKSSDIDCRRLWGENVMVVDTAARWFTIQRKPG
jgi:hypothetical protein